MYSKLPSIVFGFHGCDKKVKDKILSGESFLKFSTNAYDWLGTGIYFWEGDCQRALEFARDAVRNTKQTKGIIQEPAVIGAVIDLGYCCDLMNRKNIELLKKASRYYLYALNDKVPLINKGELPDMKGRYRDCAVINALHLLITESKMKAFDTVRSVFFEGNELYDTSAFREYTHIQICVRNPNCIKAVFDPRELNAEFPIP
ncbi:hypothetical protein [Huintestinicola sp.]